MSDLDSAIWSNTDFPYMCLKDVPRTLKFKEAIEAVVKPGDIVVDVGSGSGILALFTAAAGASKVYAVEIDHTLAEALRMTAKANGFGDVIEVVEDDILETRSLPQAVDVVIAEIIETGLIDELQVPAMNKLRASGVIDDHTKVIPEKYETFVQPIYTDHIYYGFKVYAPKHEWPFYADEKAGWHPTSIDAISPPQSLGVIDFHSGPLEARVDRELLFECDTSKQLPVNAVMLSGRITLAGSTSLDATNALNGDKIYTVEEIDEPNKVIISARFIMGDGAKHLELSCKQA
jgi:hypothetical protein